MLLSALLSASTHCGEQGWIVRQSRGLEPCLGPRIFGLGLWAITQLHPTSSHLGAAWMASRGDQRAVLSGILLGDPGCLWLPDRYLSGHIVQELQRQEVTWKEGMHLYTDFSLFPLISTQSTPEFFWKPADMKRDRARLCERRGKKGVFSRDLQEGFTIGGDLMPTVHKSYIVDVMTCW